jgi:predicted methyltransferase
MKSFIASFVVAFATIAAGCAAQPSSSFPAAELDRILASEHRSAENRARDRFRHPKETLKFFGIHPEMTVVEVWPGNGWYTEILAPLVQERGKLYAAQLDPAGGEYAKQTVNAFKAKLNARPDLYNKVVVTHLASPPAKTEIAPADSVDMVLTFRNLHNWMMFNWQREALQSMFTALKPGGVLGVVEHRGNAKLPQDARAASGYVNEAYAIELIESVGFKLVDRSEVNANPADTKDYEKGVWTLPPNYALGSTQRERYERIGESDRFTLKFIKPKHDAKPSAPK